MKILLLVFSILSIHLTSARDDLIHFFEIEDTDKDGILASYQFIEGLISAFGKINYEKNMQNVNDFGREFIGRKQTKGAVKISDVKTWFETNEIFEAYQDWKYIIEEGENHHSADHIHKRPESITKK